MKKLTITLLSILLLSACSSLPPEPKSWKNDLAGIKEEPINNNIEQVTQELNKRNPNVWSD